MKRDSEHHIPLIWLCVISVSFRLVLEFDLLVFAFGKFPVVISTWLCMFLSTFILPYGLFLQWAQGHSCSSQRKIRSLFFGTLFMLFQTIGLGLGPAYVAVSYSLPPASRFVVILEQVGPCMVTLEAGQSMTLHARKFNLGKNLLKSLFFSSKIL